MADSEYNLQDMLKKMMPNVKGRLDARDADELLARLHANGLIKYVEYNSNCRDCNGNSRFRWVGVFLH